MILQTIGLPVRAKACPACSETRIGETGWDRLLRRTGPPGWRPRSIGALRSYDPCRRGLTHSSTARGGGNGKRRPRDRNPGGSEGVRNGRVAEHSGAGNLHCKDESANASAHPSWPDRGPDVSKCRRLNRRAPPRGGSRPHLQSARRQLLSENCVGTKVPLSADTVRSLRRISNRQRRR